MLPLTTFNLPHKIRFACRLVPSTHTKITQQTSAKLVFPLVSIEPVNIVAIECPVLARTTYNPLPTLRYVRRTVHLPTTGMMPQTHELHVVPNEQLETPPITFIASPVLTSKLMLYLEGASAFREPIDTQALHHYNVGIATPHVTSAPIKVMPIASTAPRPITCSLQLLHQQLVCKRAPCSGLEAT